MCGLGPSSPWSKERAPGMKRSVRCGGSKVFNVGWKMVRLRLAAVESLFDE